VSFAEGWAGSLDEWWLYGPFGLAIGLLALVVAASGAAWRLRWQTNIIQAGRCTNALWASG
jgi:hypothetical protein